MVGATYRLEILVWAVPPGQKPPWEPEDMNYKWIQLTETGGSPKTYHLNVVAMASFFEKTSGKTEVYMQDGRVYEVTETPADILALIAQPGDIVPPPTP